LPPVADADADACAVAAVAAVDAVAVGCCCFCWEGFHNNGIGGVPFSPSTDLKEEI